MKPTARLDELEGALAPLEAVLVRLDEAHAHDSATDYIRAIVDLPEEQHPLAVIVARGGAWARTRYRGNDAKRLEAKVERAVRDAVFRYHLAWTIETAAATFADRLEAVLHLAMSRLVDELDDCRADAEAARACHRTHDHCQLALRLAFGYDHEDAALALAE